METEVLCLSKSGNMPKPIRIFIFCGGLLLLAQALLAVLRVQEKALLYLITGGAMVFIAGFQKRVFLSPQGLVRESRSWTGRRRQILDWAKISHVTIVHRRDQMMLMLEQGEDEVIGIRALFGKDQEGQVRAILKEYIPSIPLETVEKK